MASISVIVPTYNQARYLRACLDSVWFQDYPGPVEIVLVNDGSTDDTAAVIAAFEADVANARTSYASRYDATSDVIERIPHDRYPKQGRTLRVIPHPRNQGLAPALNTGFRACVGEYCTYAPSDDRCAPHMLAELAAALDAGHDFAFSDMLIVDQAGEVVRRFSLPEYSFQGSFADWYLCGVAKLYRRELHDRFGWYDESLLAHDHELFQRFAEGGARLVHLPKALMYVLSHDGARNVDIHAPSNWSRLLEESKILTLRARRFLVEEAGQGDAS